MKRSLLAVALLISAACNASSGLRLPLLEGLDTQVAQRLSLARKQFEEKFSAARSAPEKAALLGQLGMIYQANEQFPAAMASYQEAAQSNPADARWPYLQAIIYQQQGQMKMAQRSFTQSLELEPSYLPTLIHLGNSFHDHGDFAKARHAYQDALNLNPDSAAAWFGLARLDLQAGEAASALEKLEKALRLDPAAGQIHNLMAQAYRKLNNREAVGAQLALASSVAPGFPDWVLASVSAYSFSPQYFIEQGNLARDSGDYVAASRAYGQALGLDPTDLPARLALALSLEILGDSESAHKHLQSALQQQATHTQANYLMARNLTATDPDSALDHLDISLSNDPKHIAARLLRADIAMHLGSYQRAQTDYQFLAQAVPDSPSYQFWSGMSALALKDCRAAISAFEYSLTVNENYGTGMLALSRSKSVCTGLSERDRSSALALAERLYQAVADHRTAATLALALAANGDFEGAMDYQREALFGLGKSGLNAELEPARLILGLYMEAKIPETPWPAGSAVFDPLAKHKKDTR